jgi:hypothetical protein
MVVQLVKAMCYKREACTENAEESGKRERKPVKTKSTVKMRRICRDDKGKMQNEYKEENTKRRVAEEKKNMKLEEEGNNKKIKQINVLLLCLCHSTF